MEAQRLRTRLGTYFVQHPAGLTQTGKPLGEQRHLLVCGGPEDLLQDIQGALFFILPEVRVRDGDSLIKISINILCELLEA